MNLILLAATLAALLCGPLLYAVAKGRPKLLKAMDGFVLVSVTALVLIEVVPETYAQAGLWSFVFIGLGLLGPTLLEHLLTHARREAHFAALAVAILGLMLHSFGDGAALSSGNDHAALALAVAIHSVPVGLATWWLMFPVFGRGLPAFTLAAMCASTAGGYVFGVEVSSGIDPRVWASFQALVAGSILHVVFGRPHAQAHDHPH
jgi:zinc transporter ZupT